MSHLPNSPSPPPLAKPLALSAIREGPHDLNLGRKWTLPLVHRLAKLASRSGARRGPEFSGDAPSSSTMLAARALAVAFASAFPLAIQAQPFPAELVAQRLQVGADWLNASMSAFGGGTRPLRAQLLPMDVGNYKDFVRLAYPEDEIGANLGEPGLSAFFQAGARVDQQVSDVCYLLYNPKARSHLLDQFIEPHARVAPQGRGSVVPYAFLVAHEVGHCLDFQNAPPSLRTQPLSPLRMEVAADAFALLVLRAANVPTDELAAVVSSRRRALGSHATWHWIQPALTIQLPPASTRLIKELWEIADKISERAN